MAFCAKCGATLTEGSAFCGGCGNPAGNVNPAAVPGPQVVAASPTVSGSGLTSNVAAALSYVL